MNYIIQDDIEDDGIIDPMPPTPGQGLSPADILHLDEEEANLMNTYLESTYVRDVASVSQSYILNTNFP